MTSQRPERPDHPDFWLISQALIDTDKQTRHSGGDQDWPTITGRYVDPVSLLYVAMQRGLALAGPFDQELIAKLGSVWVDAFIAGIKFQHMKITGAQRFDEEEFLQSQKETGDDPSAE